LQLESVRRKETKYKVQIDTGTPGYKTDGEMAVP